MIDLKKDEPKVSTQNTLNAVYQYAADLLMHQNKNEEEVRQDLIAKGIDSETAGSIVENLQLQVHKVKNESANKDMLWGAVWCIGGIVGTVAQIGFVFWGAILFGGVQFIKGVMNKV